MAEADISSVSLGNMGSGPSTAIMAASTGNHQSLCTTAPYPTIRSTPTASRSRPPETRRLDQTRRYRAVTAR